MHGELVGEGDARQPDRRARRVLVVRALDVLEVGADVLVRDHLGQRQHLEVAAGVVVVLVRVDDVVERLVGDGLDLREDAGVVAVEHVVHEHHALGRRRRARRCRPRPRSCEVALDPLGLERAWRLGGLRAGPTPSAPRRARPRRARGVCASCRGL